ncbi:hypothetical protein [Alkalicoccobacillus gibsonii]|uniref:hypothetical protein n=1 Tax=Alkalicoccobacillus gibsonii TaxID=79881 RepID=UPI001931EA91|nr:hypothetical protein [Alkalicoccobacillus gibsonii]MBM0065911.1 hypothetical protein [Alkalicoccobacillus gibsonii]
MQLENIKQLEHFTLGKSYVVKQMQYTEDLVIENDLGERKRLDLKATTFSEVDRIELEWLGSYFDIISDKKETPIVRQTSKQKRAVTQLKVGYWVSLVLVCMAVVPIMIVFFRIPNAWMEQNPFFIIDLLYFVLRFICAGVIGGAIFSVYERFSLYYKRKQSGLPMKTLRMEET